MGMFDNITNPSNLLGSVATGTGVAALAGPGMGLSVGIPAWLGGAFNPKTGQSYVPGMAPMAPGHKSVLDEAGNLKAQYQMKPGQLGDSSKWQALMKQQNEFDINRAISDAQAQAMSGARGAQSALAQGGGLGAGARERAVKAGAQNAMFAGQAARGQGFGRGLDIGLQGEMMDRDAQRFNIGTGMDAQRFNLGAAMGDIGAQNQYNMGMYGQDVARYGSQEAAAAQRAAAANRPVSIWEKLGGIF